MADPKFANSSVFIFDQGVNTNNEDLISPVVEEKNNNEYIKITLVNTKNNRACVRKRKNTYEQFNRLFIHDNKLVCYLVGVNINEEKLKVAKSILDLWRWYQRMLLNRT